MALKQINPEPTKKNPCPRCGQEALIIEGKFVRWLTCINPKCRFKKLMEKEDNIKVVSLKEEPFKY